MNRVIRHEFLRKYPIVLVDNMKNWANGLFEDDSSYYHKIKINGRPLSYIIIDTNKATKIYGKCDESVIASTMAIIAGDEKYPMNQKLSVKYALDKCVENNHRDAYNLVSALYESVYKSKTVEEDWSKPHQQDKLDDQFDDQDDINSVIDKMDDEAENDIHEAVKKPLKKQTKKPLPKKKVASKKTTKKALPKKAAKKTTPSKSTGKKKFPGYTHVTGGDGNLYVKGDIPTKQAQAIANKQGATHKDVGGKLQPLSASEMIGMRKNQGQGQQTKPKSSQQATKTQQKTDNKSKGNSQNPTQKSEPTVVKVAKAGSKEHQSADAAIPIKKVGHKESATQSELNIPYSGEKNREVDPEYADSVQGGKEWKRPPTISDAEFESKNKGKWVNKNERIKLNSVRATGVVPNHTIATLERIINTKLDNDTKKLKNHFSPEAGAGDARSQAGELMTLAMCSLDPKAAKRLRDEIISFIDDNGNTSIMEKEWAQAAYDSSRAIRKHLSKKYGSGSWEPIGICWDTQKEFEAMTGLNYKESKGRSSDMYMLVNTESGPQLIDISLKKSLDIKFVNSGPESILKYDSSSKGSDLDVSVHVNNERKWLQKVANPSRINSSIKWLKSVEKNLDRIQPPKARKSAEEAIKLMREIGGKDMNSAKISKAIKLQIDDKAVRKAAWMGIYAMAQAGVSKDAQKVVEDASKIYVDYSKKFMSTVATNKKLKNAMLEMIRDSIPIGDIASGGEIMALGKNMFDKATMKEMFGTSDPKEIRDGLTIVAGPPPYIGYAAGKRGSPIPIATIRLRPEALGYGNRIKFDMDMHPKFKDKITYGTNSVYGDDEEE